MATSIPHFVSFEALTIDTLCLFRLITRFRHWTLEAVIWMEAVVHVALELISAMKPFMCRKRVRQNWAEKVFLERCDKAQLFSSGWNTVTMAA
jgi:hypothetical protein